MFPSFTGSARRQRQVNLSNRNTNIFAGHTPGRHAPSGLGPQATLAAAQQERLQRQQERDRLQASRVLQRIWRGHKSRRQTRAIWRNEWDMVERKRNPDILAITDSHVDSSCVSAYPTAAECMAQLRALLHFLEFSNVHDAVRLAYFAKCFQKTLEEAPSLPAEGEWASLIARFGKATLRFLSASIFSTFPAQLIDDLLQLIIFLPKLVPRQMTRYSQQYYTVIAGVTLRLKSEQLKGGLVRDSVMKSVLALLQPITSETLDAYEWFARVYLTIPSLSTYLDSIDDLAAGVNYKLLASAIDSHILRQPDDSTLQLKDLDAQLWLLAYFIFFYRRALGDGAMNQSPEPLFVKVVSKILGSAASVVAERLDADRDTDKNSVRGPKALPPFVHDELLTLVNQHSITHLLSQAGPSQSADAGLSNDEESTAQYAKSLASYALTLLRVFPQRGDEIRMWLYLGSTYSSEEAGQLHMRIPAIKYFWGASKLTKVFDTVISDARAVLPTLLPPDSQSPAFGKSWPGRDQEWTIILIFLELYTFLLKVLDDEEFFSAGTTLHLKDGSSISWTQESALPLSDVKVLTSFLKNLAFTLCWNAADLAPPETSSEPNGLSSYFSTSSMPAANLSSELSLKTKARNLGGVTGIPLDYFKGLVTGLLRMIHERDSRRKFLPDGHWLMTGRLDMEGFIPTVVAEEEKRHNLQDEEDEDEEGDDVGEDGFSPSGLVGTGQAQNIRRIELLRKRQQQLARRKELEAIAPRLEILRNMPFFIPFATRVQIFRAFIRGDQLRRRNGFVDPDAWRLSVAQSALGLDSRDVLAKHHAEIRRDNLFEDAFSQFYELGEGLKEPIQISFIDKFGTPEAGIDGGGVTKEFLTSIINEAFDPSSELSLFIENDKHLLHPNPAAVEQRKALLRQRGMVEGSKEWEAQIRELLKRYEFIGRIIGKCLYEGILVDVNFAGFFLLKWALTGGTSSARRESAYRANLNDLRDLDEALYQGLLQLKNYPGDVEDFALNFTVTDTVTIPGDSANGTAATTRSITKDLKPNGSNIPVTNQNRLVYISYMARHRLQRQPFYQTNAFLQGLGQIIQPSWLSMFNQAELQTLVGGDAGEIDVEDLRRNTTYSGVYVIGDDGQEHPTVALFWEVLRAMSNADKGKVLKFVTSTPRAPLLGFSHLNPRFSIRDSSGDEERLPSASTCANLLKLPRYSSANTLREKLMYAVSSGAGFDLS